MKVCHLIHAEHPREELIFERGLFDNCYKMRLEIDGKTAYRERTPYTRDFVAKSIRAGRHNNGPETVTFFA